MKICGILGRNISYTKSPVIHNDYYRFKNIALKYFIFDVAKENFPSFIKNLKENNIIGFNVTIPYKEIILPYLNKLNPPADKIKAVNTVLVTEDGLEGFNTDYYGFIRSLEDINFSVNNLSALIIGSGGAAKAVTHALMDNNCGSVKVTTRNVEKAKIYFSKYCEVLPLPHQLNISQYDLVVNCTPIGNYRDLNSIPFEITSMKQGCLVYDLIYDPIKTKFLSQAENKGALIINGDSMLKYQAYKAADIWMNYINV